MHFPGRFLAAVAALMGAACSTPLLAQNWELGVTGGAAFINQQTISGPAGSAEAKLKPGFGFGGLVGQIGNRVGGEIRYAWFKNDMELTSGSAKTTMGGRTQTLIYNVLIYTGSKESSTRGYAIIGGGTRQFEGTGPETAIQPTGRIAVLTKTSEWKPALAAGGGVRVAVSKKTHLRLEVLGLFSQAPEGVITPVNGTLSGWCYSFSPTVALSYVF
jgi:opacity protein-like surface antigen